jgi:hypothetical protein
MLGADAAELRDARKRGAGSTTATEAGDFDPLAGGSPQVRLGECCPCV